MPDKYSLVQISSVECSIKKSYLLLKDWEEFYSNDFNYGPVFTSSLFFWENTINNKDTFQDCSLMAKEKEKGFLVSKQNLLVRNSYSLEENWGSSCWGPVSRFPEDSRCPNNVSLWMCLGSGEGHRRRKEGRSGGKGGRAGGGECTHWGMGTTDYRFWQLNTPPGEW